MTEGEDEVRIAGKTPAGAKFVLVLNRVPGLDGESTRLHVDWAGEADGRSKATVAQALVDVEQRYAAAVSSAKK